MLWTGSCLSLNTDAAKTPRPSRLAHHRSVDASNPRPCAYSDADRPPDLHSRTRSVHFDSVSVMTPSLRYAASLVDDGFRAGRTHVPSRSPSMERRTTSSRK